MSITHLGIKVRELDLRHENNIWKDMDVCKDCASFHEAYVNYILDNGDKGVNPA